MCAGTVTAGQNVETDANGKAVTHSTGKALGQALTTATDAIIEIMPFAAAAGGSVVNVSTLSFPVLLSSVANGDIVTGVVPGYPFKILGFSALVTTAVTTGAKAASFNLEIGTTNLTGGVIALTSANATPLGAIVASSAITAANVGSSTAAISIEAASVTTFAEGAVTLLISIQNLS